jgi:preprotein translocase subunit SecA
MLKKFVTLFSGDQNKRTVGKFADVVDQVNALEAQFEALSRHRQYFLDSPNEH